MPSLSQVSGRTRKDRNRFNGFACRSRTVPSRTFSQSRPSSAGTNYKLQESARDREDSTGGTPSIVRPCWSGDSGKPRPGRFLGVRIARCSARAPQCRDDENRAIRALTSLSQIGNRMSSVTRPARGVALLFDACFENREEGLLRNLDLAELLHALLPLLLLLQQLPLSRDVTTIAFRGHVLAKS